ncbi:hypothetical protein H6F87_20095 [Cyanobacteria bacterium FACHB-502]|uniref:hypothetical protein n=1 Tax=Leptolyngbya sp. GB1-A1 TaxID=2933908 RepID=UPI00198F884D|nr:hypothetical protein [Cyanobacteria bacterium FACHB-502]
MADQSLQAMDLDATIAALQQGVTSIPLDEAIAIIETWQSQLQGHDLAEDLGELKAALQNGNSGEIAKLLIDIGEDASGASSIAPSEVMPRLQQLGQVLYQAGHAIK